MAIDMQFFIARAELNAWRDVDNVEIHAFGRKPKFAARTSFDKKILHAQHRYGTS